MDKLMEELERDIERMISQRTRSMSTGDARRVVEYVREELLSFLQGLPEDEVKKDD